MKLFMNLKMLIKIFNNKILRPNLIKQSDYN